MWNGKDEKNQGEGSNWRSRLVPLEHSAGAVAYYKTVWRSLPVEAVIRLLARKVTSLCSA